MRILSRIFYYIFIFLSLALIIVHIPQVVIDSVREYKSYLWFGCGAGAYLILHILPFFRKNEKWLQTFSHELTHTVVGMMFFRKIHSFNVEDAGTGAVQHSGRRNFGGIFISLSPYCFPIFTYLFMLLRILGSENMFYIFDIFIGFTAAFHFLCFWSQTGSYQSDIQKYGLFRSYLFIAAWRLLNMTIILLTIRTGIIDAVTFIFPEYWHTLTGWWNYVSGLVMSWIK